MDSDSRSLLRLTPPRRSWSVWSGAIRYSPNVLEGMLVEVRDHAPDNPR
jgi:hypothetical protein